MKKHLLISLLSVLMLSPFVDAAAQRVVSGKVTDAADNSPLAGVMVMLKNSGTVEITRADGAWSLNVPAGQQTLVFSLVGFGTQEVAVADGKTTLDVKLTADMVAIESVVVTGFQNIKKEAFTGSSVKVAMDDVNVGGMLDVGRMLEGKVAGVSIQNVSSTFGSAPKMRIRGVTSINGENKPLWVVDGVVLEDVVNVSNDQLSSGDPTTLLGSSVAGLNNSDIESMDILKDAAATAMYGARAMNGVIVITTKRGKSGVPVISYNGNFTMRTKPRYENFDIMNSADQMAVNAELYRKGLIGPKMVNWANSGPYGLMYRNVGTWNPDTGFDVVNDSAHREAFLRPFALANTDWFDLLFTNNLIQEHSLSISAGSERSRTYSSVSFMNDAGQTVADRVSRYTFNVKNDFHMTDKITTVMQFTGSYRQQKVPGSFTRGSDPVGGTWSRDFDINPFSYAYNTSRAVRPYDENGNLEFVRMNYAPFNILSELGENWMDLGVVDVKGQGQFTYEFFKGLKFNAIGALRYVNSTQQHTITERSNVAEAYRAADNDVIRDKNPFLWRDPESPGESKVSVLPKGGFFNTERNEMLHYNVRADLAYKKTWDTGIATHELNALAGTEVKFTDRMREQNNTPGYIYYDGQRFEVSELYYRMLSSRNAQPHTINKQRERQRSYYLSADYTYDRRYTLSLTGRYDGSNMLGNTRSSQWLPTGSVSATWNIANEEFMSSTKGTVDLMKIRGSFGMVATMPLHTSSSAIFYATTTFAPGYQQDAVEIAQLANANLTWEKAYMYNAGFDLEMFRNRLNFTFEYWNRQSFDLVAAVPDSGIGGWNYKMGNYANLFSSGMDVTLGGTIVRNNDWMFAMNFTLGYSTNRISKMQTLPSVFSLVSQIGGNTNNYPVNSLFSVPFVGLDPNKGTPIYLGPDGKETDGAYMQSANTSYLTYNGPVDPPLTGGLTANVSWKGISASVFVSYQGGNMVRLNPSFSTSYSDLSGLSLDFKNRWMASDGWIDNVFVPAILDRLKGSEQTNSNGYNVYNYSSARVAKGDFIRLKTVSLGYDFPAEWLEKSRFFRSASIRATGRDLWLMWSDKRLNGQDPEFLNTGGVAFPAMPSVVVSLSLGF